MNIIVIIKSKLVKNDDTKIGLCNVLTLTSEWWHVDGTCVVVPCAVKLAAKPKRSAQSQLTILHSAVGATAAMTATPRWGHRARYRLTELPLGQS